MMGEACLLSNAYYPRTPDYTLYSGVHVCWSENSDSSFFHGFVSLDYGLGIMTAATIVTLYQDCSSHQELSKNMAARRHGLFSLYIYTDKKKSSCQKPLDRFQYNLAEMFLW